MRSSAAANGVCGPATARLYRPGPSASSLRDSRPVAKLAVEIEQRCRVAADQRELRDDLASRLLFLDLLGEAPLELDRSGVRFLLKGELVERVDLLAPRLRLLPTATEYI